MKDFARCLIAAVCVAGLAGCAQQSGSLPDGGSIGKTVGGVPTHRTAWKRIAPREIVVNVIDLKGAAFTGAEQRRRDNALVQQRAWFDDGRGWLWIEHNVIGRFNRRTTWHFNDPDAAKDCIAAYYAGRGQAFTYAESRQVYAPWERGGWIHLVRSPDTDAPCVFALVGFLSTPAKLHSRITEEVFDTGIDMRDCSGARSLEETESFLRGMKIVPSGYNRGVAGG